MKISSAIIIGLMAIPSLCAEENSILGDWALNLPNKEVGWLSISQDEDGKPHAELMWAVGGVRQVSGVTLKDNQLSFELKRKGKEQTFVIRYQDDLLFGSIIPILNDLPVLSDFTGKRMPPIPPKPDLSKVKFGSRENLFNGKDLTGWKVTDESKINGWSVKDGVMVNDTPKKDFSAYGDHANLRTEKEFEDFRLHIEFQPPPGGNSGVYLRGMYEVQVVDRDSKMQGLQGVGSIFGRIKATENAGKPGGEWNIYDITLVDRHVTVMLNGVKVIDNQPVPGPTGGAIQSDVTKPGPIYLQGDHTAVKYRNIWIEPVVK